MTRIVSQHGATLESLLLHQDPGRTGTIPVKAFSQCLRVFDADVDDGGSGGNFAGGRTGAILGGAGAAGGAGGEEEKLTRADRKALYRKWTVRGRVRYGDFLRESGYRPALAATQQQQKQEKQQQSQPQLQQQLRRRSDGRGSRPRKKSTPPPPTLLPPKNIDDENDDDDDDSGQQKSKGSSTAEEEEGQKEEEGQEEEEGQDEDRNGSQAEGLLERAKVVLVHLSEVCTPLALPSSTHLIIGHAGNCVGVRPMLSVSMRAVLR